MNLKMVTTVIMHHSWNLLLQLVSLTVRYDGQEETGSFVVAISFFSFSFLSASLLRLPVYICVKHENDMSLNMSKNVVLNHPAADETLMLTLTTL